MSCDPPERAMLDQSKLNLTHSKTTSTTRTIIGHNPTMWQKPQGGFLKMNFDGASKGNPRHLMVLRWSSEMPMEP